MHGPGWEVWIIVLEYCTCISSYIFHFLFSGAPIWITHTLAPPPPPRSQYINWSCKNYWCFTYKVNEINRWIIFFYFFMKPIWRAYSLMCQGWSELRSKGSHAPGILLPTIFFSFYLKSTQIIEGIGDWCLNYCEKSLMENRMNWANFKIPSNFTINA